MKQIKSSVFSGVSVQTVEHTTLSLEEIVPVSHAWRSHKIKLMPNVEVSNFASGVTNYSVHAMTGVDKVHASGVLGKGAKVAIVDTGVDYSHPAVS